jgi:putative metallohydrolase (TIGR04338 family)
MQAELTKLMSSDAFKEKFIPLTVLVSDGRRRKSACCQFNKDRVCTWFTLKMPKHSRHPLILMHELAHAYAYFQPWHGEQFCSIYLNLVELYMGEYAAAVLKQNFDSFKVRY